MRVFLFSLALLAWSGSAPVAVAPAEVVHRTPPEVEIAEDVWQGALVDWDCKQKSVEPACLAGPATKRFALSVDGGVLLRFDERGNELALEAFRKGRSTEAIVVGKREGRLLTVESVQIAEAETRRP